MRLCVCARVRMRLSAFCIPTLSLSWFPPPMARLHVEDAPMLQLQKLCKGCVFGMCPSYRAKENAAQNTRHALQ